jgi:hypothetical protein
MPDNWDNSFQQLNDIQTGAAHTKAIYDSYVEAGFTESQAIRLTIAILTVAVGGGAGVAK